LVSFKYKIKTIIKGTLLIWLSYLLAFLVMVMVSSTLGFGIDCYQKAKDAIIEKEPKKIKYHHKEESNAKAVV